MQNLSIWARVFRESLQHPLRVFLLVGVLALLVVLADGTLFRLWSLGRDRDRLMVKIDALKQSIREKNMKLSESNRPEFIERQVREQLDLVRDGDLVFVFSDSADDQSELGIRASR
jgi:cell division protein FtsB